MGKLVCRVCGAEYEGCRTARHTGGSYRWQDVACCPEHGSIYLERIIASRQPKPEALAEKPTEPAAVPEVIEEISSDEVNAEEYIFEPISESCEHGAIDAVEEDAPVAHVIQSKRTKR